MRYCPSADSSAYTKLIFDHLPGGVALFHVSGFYLLAANANYQALLGPEWQQGRAIGHRLIELLPHQELSDCLTIFKHVAEMGTPFRSPEYAVMTSTGRITYWDWTLTPLYSAEKHVCYLLLTVSEVTDQVKARQRDKRDNTNFLSAYQANEVSPQGEEGPPLLSDDSSPVGSLTAPRCHTIAASERQRFYSILDQLPEGVLLVEATTSKISYANAMAAHLLGLPASQLLGVPLNQSMHTTGQQQSAYQFLTKWNFALIHALWGETVTNWEVLVTRPDGSEAVMFSSVSPIRTTLGIITEAVIVFQDITKQKTLEQQKNEFFAVVNHELRTPLTVIVGFAELLQQYFSKNVDPMQLYAINSINQECERLRQLIHETLDVSRLEYTRLEVKKIYQDLLAPLLHIVEKYHYTARKHHLLLTTENLPSDRLLMGWFDLARIEQMIDNLLLNALKYSPAGSEIEIGIRYIFDHNEVVIWIKDQGMGIPAQDLSHIFERFYRSANMDRSISGFGIGLYLAKEIIQEHEGAIWAESTEGQGSTFFVRLPLEKMKPE